MRLALDIKPRLIKPEQINPVFKGIERQHTPIRLQAQGLQAIEHAAWSEQLKGVFVVCMHEAQCIVGPLNKA